MTQHNITTTNPYQRSRYQRSERGQQFVDYAKKSAPDLYKQLMQEDAWMREAEAAAPRVEAILNDPAFIEWSRHYENQLAVEKQKDLKNELLLLGIEAGATKREIRNAYRRKARKLHPDVGGDSESFKQLHAAYRLLLTMAKE